MPAPTGPSRITRGGKRFIDVVGAAALLLLTAPLMAVVAALIPADSRGPVIFKASRVGRDGRPFTLYKFRTMCADAQAQLPALAHRNLGGPRLIRIPDDPRITRVGRVLRRTGLDELPQLLNVLRGDMSLVGPRPQAPDEVALYSSRERERLAVRPGITGLWQVTAWERPSFDEWVRADLQYLNEWSLGLDLWILARTPWAIVRRAMRAKTRTVLPRAEERAGGDD
jgi:lipopolysaccharide/colanic/teichoic acid biosynthesis glycosyltransferase